MSDKRWGLKPKKHDERSPEDLEMTLKRFEETAIRDKGALIARLKKEQEHYREKGKKDMTRSAAYYALLDSTIQELIERIERMHLFSSRTGGRTILTSPAMVPRSDYFITRALNIMMTRRMVS